MLSGCDEFLNHLARDFAFFSLPADVRTEKVKNIYAVLYQKKLECKIRTKERWARMTVAERRAELAEKRRQRRIREEEERNDAQQRASSSNDPSIPTWWGIPNPFPDPQNDFQNPAPNFPPPSSQKSSPSS